MASRETTSITVTSASMNSGSNMAMAGTAVESESASKRRFLEEHRDELIASLAAAWRPSLLEFLKTYGCLDAVQCENIIQAGPTKRRAEALVKIILSFEDVRVLWKSFWLGLNRYLPAVFQTFANRIERELGYQALVGIVTPSRDQTLHVPSIDVNRPSPSGGDHGSLDAVSGGIADSVDGSSRGFGAAASRSADGGHFATAERYREERNAARKERAEAVEENIRLTTRVYRVREENAALKKSADALKTKNTRLSDENTQLTTRNDELVVSMEEIRGTQKQGLMTYNKTMEHLLSLQEDAKQHQLELIHWMEQVQELDAKVKHVTAADDASKQQLQAEQALSRDMTAELEAVRQELEESRAKLKGSIPINCVSFAHCRHSVSDSGVQSDSYMVEGREVPVVFLREVDVSVQLPVDSSASDSITADSAVVITGVTDSANTEGGKLFVGDEVREVNGGACCGIDDFRQRISDTEKPLNLSVRRRLVLRDCKSCSVESGTISSPISALPNTVIEELGRRAQNNKNAPPLAVSPTYSTTTTDGDRDRPQSSAGMCALSTSSSIRVHHKAELAASCSTDNLPDELSAGSDKSDHTPPLPSPKLIRSAPQPLRVRMDPNIEVLRGTGDLSPRTALLAGNRHRSQSIPHLSNSGVNRDHRRSSEPYILPDGVNFASLHTPVYGSLHLRSSDQHLLPYNREVSEGYKKIDHPLRFTEGQLKQLGVGVCGRREIAIHRVNGDDDDGAVIEVVGGRGCGTYIKSAPQWVLNHDVRIGDRILFVHIKDVRNAPLQLVQFCLDNTISFSGKGHIIVEADEEGFEKVEKKQRSEDFYVRSNFNALAQRQGDLNISAGDILHIGDTMYRGQVGRWYSTKVEHYKDSERKGTVPCPQSARRYVIETGHTQKGLAGDSPRSQTHDMASHQGDQDVADAAATVDMEQQRTQGCSPHHGGSGGGSGGRRAQSASALLDADAQELQAQRGLLQRARHLLGIGSHLGRRRGSKTVTQLATAIAMGTHPRILSTPPYEYIELVKEEKARPVILFGSFSYYILRELQRQFPSHYTVCEKTYFKTLAERKKLVDSGELVYMQPIETPNGYECITAETVQECLDNEMSPLIEPDMDCIARLQNHGIYAITICLRPTNKSKLKHFVESLSGRPFSDCEVADEITGVRESYEAYKHMLTDVMEIKGGSDKEIPRLHRLIVKNLRSRSWVSSLDQPDFSFDYDT